VLILFFLSRIDGSQQEFEGVFLPSILLYHLSQFGCTIHSQREKLNVAEVELKVVPNNRHFRHSS
jgi:hypothetical protein